MSPARIGAASSALAVGLSGWLVWVRTGERGRNSYEAFDSAARLGLDELIGGTAVRLVWFLVPVAALAVIGLVVLDRMNAAVGALAVVAAIAVVASVGVLLAGVESGPGPLVALGGAALGVVVGMAHLVGGRSRS